MSIDLRLPIPGCKNLFAMERSSVNFAETCHSLPVSIPLFSPFSRVFSVTGLADPSFRGKGTVGHAEVLCYVTY